MIDESITSEAVGLLKSLISIPSLSREEEKAADYLQNYIEAEGMTTGRKGNNIWCLSPMFDLKKPTILLNSHIDTVKPVNGWRKDPFTPREENGKLYGLGSNDAGASVVTLLQVFLQLCRGNKVITHLPGILRRRSIGKRGYRKCIARTSSYQFCRSRRTYRNATCHCRKRVNGT